MIDDSADRNREKVVISGAALGDAARWSALRATWRERLARDGIEYFKSSHCRYLQGQFHKYRDEVKYPKPLGRDTADQIQNDLHGLLKQCRVITLGAVIPVPLYKQFQENPKYSRLDLRNPYHWAVQTVWMMCAKTMKKLGRGNVVTFAHDNGNDYPFLLELYKAFKKKNRHSAKVMHEFIPLNDKTNPPIQAADVAASVTHLHALEWIANPGPLTLKQLEGTMYWITVWNEEYATEVMDNELRKLGV
jgi:hypothetical protein